MNDSKFADDVSRPRTDDEQENAEAFMNDSEFADDASRPPSVGEPTDDEQENGHEGTPAAERTEQGDSE